MAVCHAPSSTLVIDAWGKVKLCPNDYVGSDDWGDLTTTPLQTIWDLPEFRRTRRELLQGTFKKEICRVCVGKERARRPLANNG